MLTSLLCQAARDVVWEGRQHGKCENTEITCLVRRSRVICGFYYVMVPEPSPPNHTHTKAISSAHLLVPHSLGLGRTRGPNII